MWGVRVRKKTSTEKTDKDHNIVANSLNLDEIKQALHNPE